MRAFIAHSFSQRDEQSDVITAIEDALEEVGIKAFSFVKSFPVYPEGSEVKMMDDAFRELSQSDMLIAEVSDKQIGVGIEIGYARASHIPIIYLRKDGSGVSKTVQGCAAFTVVYRDCHDLKAYLQNILQNYSPQDELRS